MVQILGFVNWYSTLGDQYNYQQCQFVPFVFIKMRKILSIINIPEANQCNSLELDYRIERKNLKRYLESLKIFKIRIQQSSTQMHCISKSLFLMHEGHSKSRKKISQLQYYMFNGIKVFGAMISMFSASSNYYAQILKRVIQLESKIAKCLKEQKKKFERLSEQQEKEIKAFAAECYPETTSILFMIGFISADKVVKKPDSFRETSIVEASKRYSSILNACLDEMQELKKIAIQIGEDFYEGAKNMWFDGAESFQQTLDTFKIDEEQVNRIADETGRVLTDRSLKSNEDNEECHNFRNECEIQQNQQNQNDNQDEEQNDNQN